MIIGIIFLYSFIFIHFFHSMRIFFFVFCSQTCLGRSQTARTFQIRDALRDHWPESSLAFLSIFDIVHEHVTIFTFCLCMFVPTANRKNISISLIMASNLASIYKVDFVSTLSILSRALNRKRLR